MQGLYWSGPSPGKHFRHRTGLIWDSESWKEYCKDFSPSLYRQEQALGIKSIYVLSYFFLYFLFYSPSTSPCVLIVSFYFCIKKLVTNREEKFSTEAYAAQAACPSLVVWAVQLRWIDAPVKSWMSPKVHDQHSHWCPTGFCCYC